MTSERLMYVQFTSCVYGIISIDFDNDLIPSVEAYYESSRTYHMELFAKTSGEFWPSAISTNKLHFRCLMEFWTRVCRILVNYTDFGYTFGIVHLILTKFFMTLEYILMVFVSVKLQLGKGRKALNQLILLLEMWVLNIADSL